MTRRHRLLWVAALVATSLAACATSGPPVRIFLVEDGQQYFVRPVAVRGNPVDLDIDFTVRKTRTDPTVTVNLTYHSLETINSLLLRVPADHIDAHTLQIRELKIIYSTNALQRWTAMVDYAEFRDFVYLLRSVGADPVLVLEVSGSGIGAPGQPPRSTQTLTRTKALRRALLGLPPL